MADMGEARHTARDAVVRPLSRAAVRPCARPGCPSPARATLSFRYATREAWLERLHDESSPATYDLCASHADRTRPPAGWGIVDQRPAEDQEPAERAPARELGDEHTVAVLAAALRAVPDRLPVASTTPAETDADIDLLAPPDDDPGVEVELVDDLEVVDDGVGDGDLTGPDELPDDLRHGIEDALAELAAVARGDVDAEQIAIALDDDTDAGTHDDVGDPAPATAPVPRPVRAARERSPDDRPGGPARAW